MPPLLFAALLAATPPPEPDRLPLAAIPAGDRDLVYEVTAAPCAGMRPLEVRVLRKGRPVKGAGVARALWPLPCEVVKAGRGRAPGERWDWEAHQKDESGEQWAGLRLRSVRLAPGLRGLLLEQAAGFEHIGRNRALVVFVQGRLRKVWEEEDGAAPTATTVELAPAGAVDQLVSARALDWGLDDPEAPDPDHYDVERLRWVGGKRRLERTPAPVHAAVFGSEDEMAAARALAARFQGKCAGIRPLVIEAAAFPKLRAERALVIAVFAPDAAAAATVRTRAKACGAPAMPTVRQAR
jgi:hypothetical protein